MDAHKTYSKLYIYYRYFIFLNVDTVFYKILPTYFSFERSRYATYNIILVHKYIILICKLLCISIFLVFFVFMFNVSLVNRM